MTHILRSWSIRQLVGVINYGYHPPQLYVVPVRVPDIGTLALIAETAATTMTDLAFDPWDTETPTTTTRVNVGTRTFSKSLHDRAMKRVDDVGRVSGRGFVVAGNERFNDTYPQYDVTWNGGDEYECSCYSTTHGETRARRTCSHVVAVMLYRAKNGATNGQQETRPEHMAGGDQKLPFAREDTPVEQPRQDDVSLDEPSILRLVPSLGDTSWTEWDRTPLPDKFQALRPQQWDAVQEIMEHYERGVEVVWLDAPTGAGKSLIAELVRRLSRQRAFYLCHTISLQNQLTTDFPYAKVLKGRANYPTLNGGMDVTCADCTSDGPEDDCVWCDVKWSCPYQAAKSEALRAKLAVLNTAYFLAEFNYVGQVGQQRELGIIDECDVLENALMGFVEFYLGERMLNRVGVSAPKEGSHYTTLGKWLVDEFRPKLYEYARGIKGDDLRAIRERMTAQRLLGDVLRIGQQVERDETLSDWVRDNKAGPFVLKPVTVGDYGQRYVWGHAKKWLCMSATIISPDELSDSCGLNGGDGEGEKGRRWETVTVPMSFPVENRPIIVAPVADMSKKGKDSGEWEYAVVALRSILDRHPNERVLVHTVSYELARYVMDRVRDVGRPMYSYSESGSRDLTLAKFRRDQRSVLVAPSMDRGVDLADDDCRVVVVMKMPYPYLGDAQVGKRMRLPRGQQWYVTQTVRKLVQMTGRAVRHDDDYCTTYILDRTFVRKLWRENKGLFPKWWSSALVTDFPVRELMSHGG